MSPEQWMETYCPLLTQRSLVDADDAVLEVHAVGDAWLAQAIIAFDPHQGPSLALTDVQPTLWAMGYDS